MQSNLAVTDKTRVKRGPKRADYSIERIHQIIDASLLCHVSQCVEGQPFITPTCHWRQGDYLYWHGHSHARNLSVGQPVAVNICQLDGLVMARSAFHHSINYRSVTLFGIPELVTDKQEQTESLRWFVDKISPERWAQLRPMTETELKATGIVRLKIQEASCKVRAAPPVDDADDYEWPVWAGVIPLEKRWGSMEQDPVQSVDYPEPKLSDAF
ncbi:pyridoxamine 5'-phosphate oxidase family protein [Nitrincola nitratireducens]|uniref:Putative flavin-nucleotide-binding protein n=1 Tax=Nitrincola nitratireducens TaxID=1229521 RepID=W9V532_9GAMM|nr:pyridoxamine 5'-phosphate oxidase family protein [Nitrincola nitratireducens]EXJ11237.1 putative flavin-nucleotide-binding protein [Nitrincola nitratireducens]